MSAPDFPRKGSSGFNAIVAPDSAVTRYVDMIQTRDKVTLRQRMDLLLAIMNSDANVKELPAHEFRTNPEFTIEECNSNLIDLSDDELLIGLPNAPCDLADDVVEEPNTKIEEDDDERSDILLSIEDIGDQAQADLLDLKAALHQGCSEIDVRVVFLDGPDSLDRLACIADDLSKLPTKQVASFLKSFVAADTTRMLQQDLAIVGRHLLFTHIKHLEDIPGNLISSCVSDFASKWPQVFAESVLLPSLLSLDRDPLVQTLARTFKTFNAKQSVQTVNVLLENLLKLLRRKRISDARELKTIDAVLGFAEILLSNTNKLEGDILNSLCQLYNEHQLELSKHRLFAKVVLDSVKRISELGHMKASILDLLSSMNHPMKNVIRKVIVDKS